MFKYILLTIAISIVAALGFAVDSQSKDATPTRQVSHDSTKAKIFASGRIEGASDEIELRSQLAGRVVTIAVREGDVVRKGQPLMAIDDRQYQQEVVLANAQLDLAKAELVRLRNGVRQQERDEAMSLLAAAQAGLERAKLNWNRVEQLHRDGAVSQQERDNQRTTVTELEAQMAAAKSRHQLLLAPARIDEVAMSEARIAAAQAKLDLAQDKLDKATVRAPGAGTILQINSRQGELVTPDARQPIVVMADTSAFRVRAFVEELDAPRVKLGMQAQISADGLPDKSFQGQITRLSPRMSRKQIWNDDPAESYDTKTREIWIELDAGQNALVVGLRVDVLIDRQIEPKQDDVARSAEPKTAN